MHTKNSETIIGINQNNIMPIVNGLWIQGQLSALELLTIQSFLDNGFSFQLWTYEAEIINAPTNTIIRNANEILSFEQVFQYNSINIHGHGKGSFAGFSDIFRYKLLYEHGGIWTDMDITCLQPFKIEEEYFFRYHHKSGAVGNFMKCPKGSELMKWCFEEAIQKVNVHNTDWMLPIKILNDGILKFGLTTYTKKISNDDSFPEVAKLLSSNQKYPTNWKIIHWMNEEFRRLNIAKDISLSNSTLTMLYNKHHITHENYAGLDVIKNKILLSRFYYLLRNIKSTLNWYLSFD